jgi:hypothetical protein
MRRIIEHPEPTLDLAFDYVMNIMFPGLPEGHREIVIAAGKVFHTAGAVWQASITKQELARPNDRRCTPCNAVETTLRRAELTIAEGCTLTPIGGMQ